MTDAPIFLLGMQRGGTNQVLNLLRSHPRTVWPQGEFHEVFRIPNLRAMKGLGLGRSLRMLRSYAPIRWAEGDLLDPDRPPERAGPGLLAGRTGRAVAAGLARSVAANRAAVARHRAALAQRGLVAPDAAGSGAATNGGGGDASDRLLVKVMNYNLAFAEDLAALYPGAVFVGLVRDGRAVCEGHLARGGDLAAAAALYGFVGRRLIDLEASGLRARTWRFEDLLADPEGVTGAIYDFCGLGREGVRGVCLQDKERVLDAGGAVRGIRKVERFYTFAEMSRHMRADVNDAALARLPAAARDAIEQRCRDVLAHFGYTAAGDTAADDTAVGDAGRLGSGAGSDPRRGEAGDRSGRQSSGRSGGGASSALAASNGAKGA